MTTSIWRGFDALNIYIATTLINSSRLSFLADFIGLDVCLAIMEVLYNGLGNTKYAPSPLLINMVTAGKKGVKSGEGFYNWNHGTKDLIVAENFKK